MDTYVFILLSYFVYIIILVIFSRIANNTLFMNIGAYKTFVQTEKDDVKEFSRMAANSARTFENDSREFGPNNRSA